MRVKILKAGKYNDKNRHAHQLNAGDELETGDRYGASLIASQFAELVNAFDQPDNIKVPILPAKPPTIEVLKTPTVISSSQNTEPIVPEKMISYPSKVETLELQKRKTKETV